MTRSESQWLAHVMHTISYLAFIDSCNTLAGRLDKNAPDDVVRATQSFIEKLQRENAVVANSQTGLQ